MSIFCHRSPPFNLQRIPPGPGAAAAEAAAAAAAAAAASVVFKKRIFRDSGNEKYLFETKNGWICCQAVVVAVVVVAVVVVVVAIVVVAGDKESEPIPVITCTIMN